MRHGVFSPHGIRKVTVDHTTIECNKESHRVLYHEPSGACLTCAYEWLSSLPFYRFYEHEDDSLRVKFGIAENVEWYKKIIKDWDSEELRGYTVEFFGPNRGEIEDPDGYPYLRILDEQNPKLLIQLLRTRVCYEPQQRDTPIFLELLYEGFRVTSAIKGMNSNIEIGTQELEPLLRVRNRMFNLSSPAFLSLKRGGRHNVKVADLSEGVKRALGKRYEELRDGLTTVKRDAKAIASTIPDWKPSILSKYPVLNAHPDLLNRTAPYDVPSDADASDGVIAPWEIAIEIAARETIPDYENYGVSSDALKSAAILPNKDEAAPEVKPTLEIG